MTSLRADALLRLPVAVRDIEVGQVVDVFLDVQRGRVVGFEVLCRDHSRCFLPLSAAQIGQDLLSTRSALTLLAQDQLDFYRARAQSLRALRGMPVGVHGRNVGVLEDVVLTPGGDILEALVANGRNRSRYRWGDALSISASAA